MGAGRKPAPYGKKNKSFRPPSDAAWAEFLSYFTGDDLIQDFEIVLKGLRLYAAQQSDELNVALFVGKPPSLNKTLGGSAKKNLDQNDDN